MVDQFDLERFVEAQHTAYETATSELRRGQKKSHWMWYLFPQLRGLGRSAMAYKYGIVSLEEARAYIAHPLLGLRLIKCTQLVLNAGKADASDIFPYPDDLKFRSCMTLFSQAAPELRIFDQALQKFFSGSPDQETFRLLGLEPRQV